MDHFIGKERMKASESSPAPTKQRDNGRVRNRTTSNPKARFPWTTAIIVFLFILMLAITIAFLDGGAKG